MIEIGLRCLSKVNEVLNNSIYQDHILDHFYSPSNKGSLVGATHSHCESNTMCGDLITISLRIGSDHAIEDIRFIGEGCIISLAAASMLTEEIKGKQLKDVDKFSAQQMLQLLGARLTGNRQKCALLSWKALKIAVYSPINGSDLEHENNQ